MSTAVILTLYGLVGLVVAVVAAWFDALGTDYRDGNVIWGAAFLLCAAVWPLLAVGAVLWLLGELARGVAR